MGTIQLPWPVSKLDDASLDIAATLGAVGDAVKAVPTENKDLVRRAVEGSVAIMQKIAAREDFEQKNESYTKPQFRKLCNVLAKASDPASFTTYTVVEIKPFTRKRAREE